MKTWLRFWTNTQLELLLGRYSLEQRRRLSPSGPWLVELNCLCQRLNFSTFCWLAGVPWTASKCPRDRLSYEPCCLSCAYSHQIARARGPLSQLKWHHASIQHHSRTGLDRRLTRRIERRSWTLASETSPLQPLLHWLIDRWPRRKPFDSIRHTIPANTVR